MLSTDRHGKSTDRDLPTLVPCHFVGGRIGNRHAGAIVSRAACTARTALDSTAETFDARVSQMTAVRDLPRVRCVYQFFSAPGPARSRWRGGGSLGKGGTVRRGIVEPREKVCVSLDAPPFGCTLFRPRRSIVDALVQARLQV